MERRTVTGVMEGSFRNRRFAACGPPSLGWRNRSASFAKFTAICRASSRVSDFGLIFPSCGKPVTAPRQPACYLSHVFGNEVSCAWPRSSLKGDENMRSLILAVFFVAALLFVSSGVFAQGAQPAPPPPPVGSAVPTFESAPPLLETGRYHPCPASVELNGRVVCLGLEDGSRRPRTRQ